MIAPSVLADLRSRFDKRLLEDQPLAKYTSARLGGPADALLTAESADELAETVSALWQLDVDFILLGGGSNLLVSDLGLRGVVVLNKANAVSFDEEKPSVWAESGKNFGSLARQAARKGFSGLEWAAGIPGTVGGAVVGNAGAHGGETAKTLELAEVLHLQDGRTIWPVEKFDYGYRSSGLKANALPDQPRPQPQAVVLGASFKLSHGDREAIQAELDENLEFRRRTQPPGASMGSMFKNPPGDYAGRLIEAAGMKGSRVGGAGISDLHANFFINYGEARAADVYALIKQVRQAVFQQSGVALELEIELVGDWPLSADASE
ncbi:MAG: UDP-N-acetylmuramate dehydrogenase [Chloroflexota bacterium]